MMVVKVKERGMFLLLLLQVVRKSLVAFLSGSLVLCSLQVHVTQARHLSLSWMPLDQVSWTSTNMLADLSLECGISWQLGIRDESYRKG